MVSQILFTLSIVLAWIATNSFVAFSAFPMSFFWPPFALGFAPPALGFAPPFFLDSDFGVLLASFFGVSTDVGDGVGVPAICAETIKAAQPTSNTFASEALQHAAP
jgi:hypothetical protein